MPSAAQLRVAIETSLAGRIPSALTSAPRLIRPTWAIGIAQLDEFLTGGLPVGAISEIVGQEGSGRTGLALAFLSQLTRQGKVCAWVDVSDALHPESAAAGGVQLDRLLWVRCGPEPHRSSDLPTEFRQSVVYPHTNRVQLGGNSPHPRSEGKGLPLAIGDLLGVKAKHKRDKIIGTPGAPNRPLRATSKNQHTRREEQVATDRQPSRRGEYVLEQREAYEPRCAEPERKPRPQTMIFAPAGVVHVPKSGGTPIQRRPWSRLDQALRVTDLLLQAGGFSAIVLDMGSILAEFASRVPLATWFRYRAAAERTQSSIVLLSQHSCAKSSAGLVLNLHAGQPINAGATVFAGLANHAEVSRRRFEQETEEPIPIRKPPQRVCAAEWSSRTAWARRR